MRWQDVPRPDAVEAFFYRAMAATGYGSGEKPTPHKDLEGWKQATHEEAVPGGTLVLLDEWGEGHEGPGGRTRIYFRQNDSEAPPNLLWTMAYRGVYDDRVIPALKQVLGVAYANPANFPGFHGCRAPSQADIPGHPGIQYELFCPYGSFMGFLAEESVRGPDYFGGRHRCSGGWVF